MKLIPKSKVVETAPSPAFCPLAGENKAGLLRILFYLEVKLKHSGVITKKELHALPSLPDQLLAKITGKNLKKIRTPKQRKKTIELIRRKVQSGKIKIVFD